MISEVSIPAYCFDKYNWSKSGNVFMVQNIGSLPRVVPSMERQKCGSYHELPITRNSYYELEKP